MIVKAISVLLLFLFGVAETAGNNICEGQTDTLSCSDKPGTVLNILYANYGRTSDAICVHPTLPSSRTDCPQQLDNALGIVKDLCQDKVSCEISANNVLFGDTCSGTYKYLEVDFECKQADNYICEGQSGTLSCSEKPGTVLDIKYANFGRTSDAICVHPTLPSSRTDCPQQLDNALGIVQALCQDKVSCEISANNGVFGDTCSGTYKYLEVDFECKQADNYICEGQSGTLSCSEKPGTVLDIKYANFGRTSDAICVHPTLPSSRTDCPQQLDNALGIVQALCQDKVSCEINANNGVFGDTCSGTYKYLEVDFECKQADNYICEGQSGTLSCSEKPGTVLDIKYANFGRTSDAICVHPTLPSSRTDCPQQLDNALGIVQALCQDKVSCEISANNGVFGDTCSGTYKYLEVDFECKQADNYICEGQTGTLSCSEKPDMVLDIKYANYGRTSDAICVHPTLPSSRTDCPQQLDNALGIVQALCQDKVSCEINANNGVFGDTCSGTYKYLEVEFECKQAIDGNWGQWGQWGDCSVTCGEGTQTRRRLCDSPSPSHGGIDCVGSNEDIANCKIQPCFTDNYICEGVTGTLSCSEKPGTVLDIKYANYGRTSDAICVHSTLPSSRTDCPQQLDNALEIVQALCQDKVSCEINANNGVFGYTCSGTYKYLEVDFECKQAIDGNWGQWGQWGDCSVTCGEGTQTRRRLCDSPAPSHGGIDCVGSNEDIANCKIQPCFARCVPLRPRPRC